jgi:methionine-rich copper-binding protein CopC
MSAGCAAPGSAGTAGSILEGSRPAAGSTVQGPVDELVLHFAPPARLDEVTVTGADGTMPMMVHSAGETTDYSLPLSGLEPGAYRVDWRARIGSRQYGGSFEFSVRP